MNRRNVDESIVYKSKVFHSERSAQYILKFNERCIHKISFVVVIYGKTISDCVAAVVRVAVKKAVLYKSVVVVRIDIFVGAIGCPAVKINGHTVLLICRAADFTMADGTGIRVSEPYRRAGEIFVCGAVLDKAVFNF